MLYGLVALAMGTMVGVSGGNAAPDAGLPASGVVVSAEHRIEFPNRIVLQLEAEFVESVVDVQLFYRIGRQDTVIYG